MSRFGKNICLALFIAFGSVVRPIHLWAQEFPQRGPIPFSTYDKDGDGFISDKEFNEVKGERMAKMAIEGRPMRGAATAPVFSEFDTDKDGKLTPEELAVGQKAQMEKRRGQGIGGNRGMGPGMGRNMPEFSDFDLNGDGKILEQEFNEARTKRINNRAQQGYPMGNFNNGPSSVGVDAKVDKE